MSLVPQSSPSSPPFSEQSPPSYWDVVGDVSFESAITTDIEKLSDIQEEIDNDTAVDDVDDDDILMMTVNKTDHIDDAENGIVSNKKQNVANIVEQQEEDVSLASALIVASNTRSSDQSTMTVTAQRDKNKVARRKSRRSRYNRRFTGYASNNQRSASSPTNTRRVDIVDNSSSPISTTRGRHSDANQLPTAVNAMYDQLDNMLQRLSRCSNDELFLHRRNIVDKLAFWRERFHRRLYALSNGGLYWRNRNETKLCFRDCQCASSTSAKHRCDCGSSVQHRMIDATHYNRICHNSVENCDNKEESQESTSNIVLTRDSSGDKSNRPWEFEIMVQPSHRQFQQPDNEHMDWAVEASKQTATE